MTVAKDIKLGRLYIIEKKIESISMRVTAAEQGINVEMAKAAGTRDYGSMKHYATELKNLSEELDALKKEKSGIEEDFNISTGE